MKRHFQPLDAFSKILVCPKCICDRCLLPKNPHPTPHFPLSTSGLEFRLFGPQECTLQDRLLTTPLDGCRARVHQTARNRINCFMSWRVGMTRVRRLIQFRTGDSCFFQSTPSLFKLLLWLLLLASAPADTNASSTRCVLRRCFYESPICYRYFINFRRFLNLLAKLTVKLPYARHWRSNWTLSSSLHALLNNDTSVLPNILKPKSCNLNFAITQFFCK